MDCPICDHVFDLRRRRPKCLPCGHTICLGCLERLERAACPTCRGPFVREATPDNYYVIGQMEQRGGGAGLLASFWCLDCKAVVQQGRCLQGAHTSMNLHAALRRRLQDLAVPQQDLPAGLLKVEDCGEGQVLAALKLLDSPAAATYRVTVQPEGRGPGQGPGQGPCQGPSPAEGGGAAAGPAFSARFHVRQQPEQEGPSDALLRVLAVVLAGKDSMQQIEALDDDDDDEEKEEDEDEEAVVALQQQHQVGQPASPGAGMVAALCLDDVSCADRHAKQAAKASLLQRVRRYGVRRIEALSCSRDPDWARDLLRAASPTLEELELRAPRRQHLALAHAMPRLQRLFVRAPTAVLEEDPPVLPALPAGQPSRLRTLCVGGAFGLPRQTLASLLRAHGAALRTLQLRVGTPGDEAWPHCGNNLQATLAQGGALRQQQQRQLPAVRLVQLCRERPFYEHDAEECVRQTKAVKRVLPWAGVLCQTCDGVPSVTF